LLEPCAGKLARTVLRGGGRGDTVPLPGDDDAHIIVTDRAGELLSFDFSLPWWRQFTLSEGEIGYMREDKSGAIANVTGDAEEAIKIVVADLLGVELLETWQPRDPITYTYVVDTPPAISFAEVLVAE
jgi:hypothetical protein